MSCHNAMVTDSAIDRAVLEAASAAFGASLSSPARLESPNLVFRASVEGGGSVIVKRVTMTEWNRGDGNESEQLLNEWCVLDHLGGRVAPRLLAADRASSLIIIEDLGDRMTIETALLDAATIGGRELLAQAGVTLARMHAAGKGRETGFLEKQRSHSTLSPRSDSTVDFRIERRDLFEEAFQVLGIDVHPRFWPEVEQLEAAIHDARLFRTLIHADAGPQNFLVGNDLRMIDFEFGVYLNAMCDLGGARVGFPQTWHTAWVKQADAALFEDAYREVAVEIWPEAADDVFVENLMMGAGHWALNRLAGGWPRYFREMLAGTYQKDDAELERRHHANLWTLFCESADGFDVLGPITVTLRSTLEAMQARFPDMVPLDAYPALAR